MFTVNRKTLRKALDEALASYDDDHAWESGDIVVETAEAGGHMGSDSSYESIDRGEFVERLWSALAGAPSYSKTHRRSMGLDYIHSDDDAC